jgi:L-iditol 2-dehydrogenase
MNACVLHAIADLRHEAVPRPAPGPGEVLVRVGACGVCGSDLPRVFEKGTYHFPTIPGHEFAGTVEAVGAEADAAWIGKKVAVFPLLPCFACPPCGLGAYAQCEHYNYLGSRCDGAFAEYVCAPVWNLLPVPEGVSMEAAAMVEPAAVAAHALRRAGLDLGDSVLIIGAGPIGVLVGLWAKAWGASRVLIADIDVARLRFAKQAGFEHLFDPRSGDMAEWTRNKTHGRGADVVVEASGSAAAYAQAMTCARTFGKVVLLGNPAGGMALPQDAYWAILRKELTVVGAWNSVYSALPKNEWQLALDAMASGALPVETLITHRTPLSGLLKHLEMIRDRAAFSCKVMYVNDATA